MTLKNHAFVGDDVEYSAPSWSDLQNLAFEIATNIHASLKKFDRVVTLAKGGWPMTRCLIDFLDIAEVASIGVKFYSGINERFDRPHIYQDLPVSVSGERLLLFDDVADTGTSLQFTKHYLLEYRGVQEVTTATLIYKPHSIITPDFYGSETSAWVIFPYDVSDMITILTDRWHKQGISKTEMEERFVCLGFKPEWIKYFLN